MGYDNFFNESLSALDLLVSSRRFLCINPKDGVFALLAHPAVYLESTPSGFKHHVAVVLESKSRGQRGDMIAKQVSEARENIYRDFLSIISEKQPAVHRVVVQPRASLGLDDFCQAAGLPRLVKKGGQSSPQVSLENERAMISASQESQSDKVSEGDSDDTKTYYAIHDINQLRRLDEVDNPRLHAVNRVQPLSFLTCATSKKAVKVDYTRSLECS
ncbi:hypothetical protein B0T26DRAFT_218866 [Lasiosphaeria miniovina]|uniref:Uncharacterized protein n=1 Tax=Lasiosphaeria miniovina TaxID=1954250 RepID=A0AA40AUU6_9PEZI|nr:uncharacterized protein B0T26DRAFT_218866 [Lasiosphaeria miniovina]KAK0722431.1 hypothetical protein B0T26DRAFT_218866 [Lasiosphaeria miniovina]